MRIKVLIVNFLIPFFAISCSRPEIRYKEVKKDNINTEIGMDSKEIEPYQSKAVFAFRPSNISIYSAKENEIVHICETSGIFEETWHECLYDIRVDSAASTSLYFDNNKTKYYIAEPQDSWWLGRTLLFPEYIDNSEGTLKSISIGYIDKLGNTISSTAAGAAAGAPFGPYGMAAGAAIGLVAGVTSQENSLNYSDIGLNTPVVEKFNDIGNYLCDRNLILENVPLDQQIYTPVVVNYTGHNSKNIDQCWRLLPQKKRQYRPEDSRNFTGWIYRVVDDASLVPGGLPVGVSAFHTVSRDEYFKPNVNGYTDYKKTFPLPTCRTVALEIAWWTTLKGQPKYPVSNSLSSDIRYMVYQIPVADLESIEQIPIPKNGGTITPMTVCGANLSPSDKDPQPSAFDQTAKGISSVLDAQPK